MLLPIVTYPDPLLRDTCTKIDTFDADLSQLADNMFETMYRNQGIGLAGPQVGKTIRLIVIDPSFGEDADIAMPLVNPEIVASDGMLEPFEEGCLSIPGVRGPVSRAAHVTVKYQDLQGTEQVIDGQDLVSIVLQHEIDHLNGVLFIDHVKGISRTLVDKKLRKLVHS